MRYFVGKVFRKRNGLEVQCGEDMQQVVIETVIGVVTLPWKQEVRRDATIIGHSAFLWYAANPLQMVLVYSAFYLLYHA